jgi:hypothetical protein
VLILKGFAVDEEAATGGEVEGAGVGKSLTPKGVSYRGGLRSGWGGPRRVIRLSGWRDRLSGLGCGDGMDHAGGRCGGIEAGSFATHRMTGGVRG